MDLPLCSPSIPIISDYVAHRVERRPFARSNAKALSLRNYVVILSSIIKEISLRCKRHQLASTRAYSMQFVSALRKECA